MTMIRMQVYRVIEKLLSIPHVLDLLEVGTHFQNQEYAGWGLHSFHGANLRSVQEWYPDRKASVTFTDTRRHRLFAQLREENLVPHLNRCLQQSGGTWARKNTRKASHVMLLRKRLNDKMQLALDRLQKTETLSSWLKSRKSMVGTRVDEWEWGQSSDDNPRT